MSALALYEGDWREWLPEVVEQFGRFKMLFADPPDNIDWQYDGYADKKNEEEYEKLLVDTFQSGYFYSDILWVSYNCHHINLIGKILYEFEKNFDVDIRHFVQYTTFGFNMKKDFSRCFRPFVRIMHPDAVTYPDAIRIESERQRIGDKRADPRGKIPPDVWAIHRVTGNSKQRRRWHPTQLNEAFYDRCLDFSCVTGDRAGDLYAGTGTIARAAGGKGLDISMFEISPKYCERLSDEHELPINRRTQ